MIVLNEKQTQTAKIKKELLRCEMLRRIENKGPEIIDTRIKNIPKLRAKVVKGRSNAIEMSL